MSSSPCPSPLPTLDPDRVLQKVKELGTKFVAPASIDELREALRSLHEAVAAAKDVVLFEALASTAELIAAIKRQPFAGSYYYTPLECCNRLNQLRQVLTVLFGDPVVAQISERIRGEYDEATLRCKISLSVINALYAVHARLYSLAIR